MTGLIYVAIIGVWAIVLVPAWLRRHDHMDPERSVDRFSRAMDTLGSRSSFLGKSFQSLVDDEVQVADPEILRPVRPQPSGNSSAAVGRPATGSRSSTPAARRRATLCVLTISALLVMTLAGVGILAPAAIAIPIMLTGGFLVLARQSAVASERMRRSKANPVRGSAPAKSATGSPAVSSRAPGAMGETWEARHAPLPSYVTAPRAAGFPRKIDTVTPGAWTAAAMLEQAQKERLRGERMAKAKAEAIARARAEQAAAEARTRDEEFLDMQRAQAQEHWVVRRGRAVNE